MEPAGIQSGNTSSGDDITQEDTKEISALRRLLPQCLAVSAKNTLALNFGLSIGFPTIVIPALMSPDSDVAMTKDQLSWLGSLFFIVIPIGCLLSGPCIHRFGRKPVMIVLCIPFFFAWLIFHFAQSATILYVAVLMHGMINGLLEAPILTYVAEVTEPKWRGMLASSSVVASLLGVFLEFLLGNWLKWRTAALVNMIFPAISFISLLFVPESPHWLVSRGRIDEAQKSLCWLRGWCQADGVKVELDSLIESSKVDKGEDNTNDKAYSISSYLQRSFIFPFGLVVLTFFIGHFSGMSTLQTYAVIIFEELGSPGYVSTVVMGLVQLIGSLVCVIILPVIGKRKLALCATFGCGVCLLVLGFTLRITDRYVSVALLLFATFLSNSCSKVLPWVLIGEVFTGRVRAVASGMASCVGYALGFLVNKTFFNILSLLTFKGVLLLYSGVSLAGCVLYFFFLPETEGRTLLEVQNHFAGKSNLIRKKSNPEIGEVNKGFNSEDL